jgi:hypothetical protein
MFVVVVLLPSFLSQLRKRFNNFKDLHKRLQESVGVSGELAERAMCIV